MEALRFGCIGCGGMGRLHVQNARHAPRMEVVSYADTVEEKAVAFLDEFGGEYATGAPAEIFADQSIAGVLIQTGERTHPSLGIAAAQGAVPTATWGTTTGWWRFARPFGTTPSRP